MPVCNKSVADPQSILNFFCNTFSAVFLVFFFEDFFFKTNKF